MLQKVYVLMELYGTTTKIQTVSRGTNVVPENQHTSKKNKYTHLTHSKNNYYRFSKGLKMRFCA